MEWYETREPRDRKREKMEKIRVRKMLEGFRREMPSLEIGEDEARRFDEFENSLEGVMLGAVNSLCIANEDMPKYVKGYLKAVNNEDVKNMRWFRSKIELNTKILVGELVELLRAI